MPTIDDLRSDLNGAKVFTIVDLKSAYHQLELHEDSRNITTFSTSLGLRRYKRLMFGLNAAAEVFQNTIAEMLADLQNCRNISDDVIIWGTDEDALKVHEEKVLRRLHQEGVRLNPEKCKFRQKKVTFFGHVWSAEGVSVDPAKVEAINNTPEPQNQSEMKSFMGMAQYVSTFIPDYATIAAPLWKLTSKDTPWQWKEEDQEAFNKLKELLTGSEVMEYFDPEKKTTLIVDASPVGLGGILTQEGKVVAYGSRALSDPETRYSQTEREMLAIVWGVEKFHLYVYGSNYGSQAPGEHH